jgi:hypothetical protein
LLQISSRRNLKFVLAQASNVVKGKQGLPSKSNSDLLLW